MLTRQLHCENLAFDKLELDRISTKYIVASQQGRTAEANQAVDEFQSWTEGVKRKYQQCFGEAAPT